MKPLLYSNSNPSKKKHRTAPSDPFQSSSSHKLQTTQHSSKPHKLTSQLLSPKYPHQLFLKKPHDQIREMYKQLKGLKRTHKKSMASSGGNRLGTEGKSGEKRGGERIGRGSEKYPKSAVIENEDYKVRRDRERASYVKIQRNIGEKRRYKTAVEQDDEESREVEEYVLFKDKIVRVNTEDILLIKNKIKSKVREESEIVEDSFENEQSFKQHSRMNEQSNTSNHEFIEIQQFYDQKAAVIQKAWREYQEFKKHPLPLKLSQQLFIKPVVKTNNHHEQFTQINQLLSSNLNPPHPLPNLKTLSSSSSFHNLTQLLPPHHSSPKSPFHSISQIYNTQRNNPYLLYLHQLNSFLSLSQYSTLIKSRFSSNNDFLQYLYNSELIPLNEFVKKTTEIRKQIQIQRVYGEEFRKFMTGQKERVMRMMREEENEWRVKEEIREKMEETVFSGVNNKEQIDRILRSLGFKEYPEDPNTSFVSIKQQKLQLSSRTTNNDPENKSKQKLIYTKQFQDILDTPPIQKFPPIFLEQHHLIKSQIEQRVLSQLGHIHLPRLPVDSSLIPIHSFLHTIFTYILKHHLHQFIANINEVYGYYPEDRLRFLILNSTESPYQQQFFEFQQIVPEAVLNLIESQYNFDNVNIYQSIHNRVIFDAVNENLHCFRPYYYSNGIAYSWCEEKVLTFYEIKEENVYEVFEKVEERVVGMGKMLCGLLLGRDKEEEDSLAEEEGFEEMVEGGWRGRGKDPLEVVRQGNLLKSCEREVRQGNFRWSLWEEEYTRIGLELSEFVFLKLIIEAVAESYKIQHC